MADSEESKNTKQTRNKRGSNPNSLANLKTGGGGRPKQPTEFKELVKANTVTALQNVIEIMNDKNAKPSDRLKASEMIIDRCYGKATQLIAGDGEHDPITVIRWANDNE